LSQDELKNDVVSFLITKIDRFDETRGFKAYSFFGKIAKNYLIQTSVKGNKRRKQLISIDSLDKPNRDAILYQIDKKLNKSQIEEHQIIIGEIFDRTIAYLEENMDTNFKKTEDKKIV